jgi:hypothetical protein
LAARNEPLIFTLIHHKKQTPDMKKVLLLATAALLVTGVSFADCGKKGKKCKKSSSCCKKSDKKCCKKGGKDTAKL